METLYCDIFKAMLLLQDAHTFQAVASAVSVFPRRQEEKTHLVNWEKTHPFPPPCPLQRWRIKEPATEKNSTTMLSLAALQSARESIGQSQALLCMVSSFLAPGHSGWQGKVMCCCIPSRWSHGAAGGSAQDSSPPQLVLVK